MFAHITQDEAIALQRREANRVIRTDALGSVRFVAGTDVAYDDACDVMVAAAVVLDATTLDIVETSIVTGSPSFPYIPHLFSFRELPPIVDAIAGLTIQPDMIVADAQGIAHPRRFGLASHLGLMLDKPVIGCAKTRLIGEHTDVDLSRGARAPLMAPRVDDQGGPTVESVGMALRTQDGVRPVFVSIGHRISIESACMWILRLTPRYRLPETTRAADHSVRMAMQALSADPLP